MKLHWASDGKVYLVNEDGSETECVQSEMLENNEERLVNPSQIRGGIEKVRPLYVDRLNFKRMIEKLFNK